MAKKFFKYSRLAVFACCIILTSVAQSVSEHQPDMEQNGQQDARGSALVALDIDSTEENDDNPVEIFDELDNMSDDVFQPTTEWQTVKPGQSIPKGLHVRLNLQTGEREAKLLDGADVDKNVRQINIPETEGSNRLQRMKVAIEEALNELNSDEQEKTEPDEMKYWKHGEREGMLNTKKETFTREELKEALKKFKMSRDDVQDPEIREGGKHKKFRSIDEIREDFKKLNMDMKTDLEVLNSIFEQYKKKDLRTEDRVSLLKDLEYYVHQIDNANNFADMGGMEILVGDLNSTNEDVRSEAALVLASAVQSNPTVQISAIESGAMQKLIRMLSLESTAVQNRVLTALAALVRNFPYAQLKFIDLGGLNALINLLKTEGMAEKLVIKAVTLVNDLLTEQFLTPADVDISDELRQQKLEQYKKVPLLKAVIEQGWCDLIPKLLDFSDHDTREKVLSAMSTLKDHCKRNFYPALPTLHKLKIEYTKLAEEDEKSGEDDGYFSELLVSINHLLDQINSSSPKNEL